MAGINEKKDPVNNPNHYLMRNGMQAIDIIREITGYYSGSQGYLIGNVLKYLLRAHKKGRGEDLAKAQKYLTWLIEEVERRQDAQYDTPES